MIFHNPPLPSNIKPPPVDDQTSFMQNEKLSSIFPMKALIFHSFFYGSLICGSLYSYNLTMNEGRIERPCDSFLPPEGIVTPHCNMSTSFWLKKYYWDVFSTVE